MPGKFLWMWEGYSHLKSSPEALWDCCPRAASPSAGVRWKVEHAGFLRTGREGRYLPFPGLLILGGTWVFLEKWLLWYCSGGMVQHRYPNNALTPSTSLFKQLQSAMPFLHRNLGECLRIKILYTSSCGFVLRWLSSLADRKSAASCYVGSCSSSGCWGWEALPEIQVFLLSRETFFTLGQCSWAGLGPSFPAVSRWFLPFLYKASSTSLQLVL